MESETKKFLDAEKAAEELVVTLSKLKQEVESYDSASKELDKIREKLSEFIVETHDVVEDSHKVLKTIKKIGGPEILEILNNLMNQFEESEVANKKRYSLLTTLISVTGLLVIASIILHILY
jgi:hypothetical protein